MVDDTVAQLKGATVLQVGFGRFLLPNLHNTSPYFITPHGQYYGISSALEDFQKWIS